MAKPGFNGTARVIAVGLTLVLAHSPAFAAGDAVAGAKHYEQRCTGCHSLDADRVGPRHRGVVGRQAGTVPGYSYSGALKASNVIWTAETLDLWLTDPQALIPGQKMNVLTKNPAIRADIIAYLTGQPAGAGQ